MTNYNISKKFRRQYDIEAHKYDYTRYRIGHGKLFYEISNRIAYKIIKSFVSDAQSEILVLDFATGTGKLAYVLRSNFPFKIIGLDISFNMLSKATSYGKKIKNDIFWVNGDGLNMPFKDNTFDHIISFKFLHIMESKHHYNFLKELFRVLKPGGKLIMDCNNGFFGLFLRLRNRKYRRPASRFYWPHHKYTIYRDFKIVRIVGEWFPFLTLFIKINKNFVKFFDKLAYIFPFYYLYGKIVLIFEK